MKRLFLFAAMLFWCAALLVLRIERTGSLMFVFLVWNLFLAVIPLAAALLFERLRERGAGTVLQAGLLGAWLLFLPNAPYIVTDLLHLRVRPQVPLWYDLALLLSAAGTGLLMGYASVVIVHRIVARQYGAFAGWSVAVMSLVLSSFGMYLGRFLRWNSWNVVTAPGALLTDVVSRVLNPFDHPKTIAVTAIFSVLLTLGYVALQWWELASGTMSPACPNPPIRRWGASMPSTSARRS
ncbi:MAG: hypothetical protein QOH21_2307 [Acidobacteriota bacterium]|jgi:uncharacterized membrane protein|nr:hypothetical protein [Acidobacteriota bacterium]